MVIGTRKGRSGYRHEERDCGFNSVHTHFHFPPFLCSAVEPFSEKHISRNVLKKLLQKDIAREITQQDVESGDLYLYRSGTVANYFVLILEGCVEVTIGREGMSFEGRSFSYYGHQVLVDAYNGAESQYAPDFSLRPVTACMILIVTYNQYVAALKATSFGQERCGSLTGGGGGGGGTTPLPAAPDHFMSEWQKAESEDHQEAESSKLAAIMGVLRHKMVGRRSKHRKLRAPDKQMLLPPDDESAKERPTFRYLEEPPTADNTAGVPEVMISKDDGDLVQFSKRGQHKDKSFIT